MQCFNHLTVAGVGQTSPNRAPNAPPDSGFNHLTVAGVGQTR